MGKIENDSQSRLFGNRTMRTAIIVISVALICGLLIYELTGSLPKSNGQLSVKVTLDGAKSTRTKVAALGRLEPESEVVDLSGPVGTRVHSLECREGDTVAKGDILARTDDYARSLAVKQRAMVRLREAEAMLAAVIEEGEAAVEEAELQLQRINVVTPLEIAAQEAIARRVEGELQIAKRTLDRYEKLRSENNSSEQQVDDQTTIVGRLEETLAQARVDLSRLKQAQTIDRHMAQVKLRLARIVSKRKKLETQIESAKSDLVVAEAELEHTLIRAPVNGTILKLLTFPGEKIDEDPILKMGNTNHMYAVAEVYETDARFVQINHRATVTSQALPAPLTGTVERISPLIFKNDVIDVDPTANVDARVVETRIRLDDSSVAAEFNNLQVRVTIDLTTDDTTDKAAALQE